MDTMDYLKEVPANESEAVERRLTKAKDPRTSPFELKILSRDCYWFIRNFVAANPGTPAGTISDLCCDPDSRVQETAQKTLENISVDLSDYKLPLLGRVHASEVRMKEEKLLKNGGSF